MTCLKSLWINFRFILCISLFIIGLILPSGQAIAKTPPEIRNQEEFQITKDMHGLDLRGHEFVKADLRGVDMSDADLRGAVFNNSQLQEANLKGADLEDVVAFASLFDRADLRDSNFTNALLMESVFSEALINGADFSDAVMNRLQKRELCARAEGTSSSGLTTAESLDCRG